MLGVAGDAVLVLRRYTRRHGFGGGSTRARRRAVARRRDWLVADLRAVEELASLSQLAGGEVGTYLHHGSAMRAKPCGRIND